MADTEFVDLLSFIFQADREIRLQDFPDCMLQQMKGNIETIVEVANRVDVLPPPRGNAARLEGLEEPQSGASAVFLLLEVLLGSVFLGGLSSILARGVRFSISLPIPPSVSINCWLRSSLLPSSQELPNITVSPARHNS
jgi:hypothetical protein